jgi:L-threonylcarbamoyladenylate synthase
MDVLFLNFKKLPNIYKVILQELKDGKVIICPTDTVYGLIADASNKKAVEKIFLIKKRSKEKTLPIFVKDIKTLRKIADLDREKEKILKKFWPGKITFVLKAKTEAFKLFPFGIIKDNKTIAVRIPNYKFLNFLLKKGNLFLTATSANISGNGSLIKPIEILKEFEKEKEKPDLFLNAGTLKNALPSTIFDLTQMKILRKGSLKENKLKGLISKTKI